MDRVKRNTTATISNTWYSDGTVTDPDVVTIEITRADGTVLVAAGAATSGAGAAARTFNLTTAHTSLLDTLTVTWTSATLGLDTTTHEIVGDFLFTIAELAADLGTSTTTYTAKQMNEARIYAETQLEHACGVAFAPRYARETFSGNGTTTVVLRWPCVTAVRSVSIDGTAVTPVSSVVALREGLGYLSTGWTAGYGNVVIDYEHGHAVLDPGASEAALVLAKHKLVKGPIDERATQRASEFGPVNLATPGLFGSRFGIPVVDAFVAANNMNVGVA